MNWKVLKTEKDFEEYGIDPIEGANVWRQKTVKLFENAVRRQTDGAKCFFWAPTRQRN